MVVKNHANWSKQIVQGGKNQFGQGTKKTGLPHLTDLCKFIHISECTQVSACPCLGRTRQDYSLEVLTQIVSQALHKSVLFQVFKLGIISFFWFFKIFRIKCPFMMFCDHDTIVLAFVVAIKKITLNYYIFVNFSE